MSRSAAPGAPAKPPPAAALGGQWLATSQSQLAQRQRPAAQRTRPAAAGGRRHTPPARPGGGAGGKTAPLGSTGTPAPPGTSGAPAGCEQANHENVQI